jgi:hypothetical protein
MPRESVIVTAAATPLSLVMSISVDFVIVPQLVKVKPNTNAMPSILTKNTFFIRKVSFAVFPAV